MYIHMIPVTVFVLDRVGTEVALGPGALSICPLAHPAEGTLPKVCFRACGRKFKVGGRG